MEYVAWLAGEPHGDGPRCTSPVIAAFVRAFNDVIPSDAGRDYYLRSWIPRLVNTRSDAATEESRAIAVVDAMVRVFLPMRLEQQGCTAEAGELAGMKPITTCTGAILAGLAVRQECGHRRVGWAIKMATRELPAALWVPVAAGLIAECGSPAAFEQGVRLLSRLTRMDRLGLAREDRDRRTAPPSAS